MSKIIDINLEDELQSSYIDYAMSVIIGRAIPDARVGQNVELKAGDEADVIVVIGGSAKVHGKVRQDVVTIGGGSEVDGEVGQNVVAIAGSIHLKPGAKIGQDTVAVMARSRRNPR